MVIPAALQPGPPQNLTASVFDSFFGQMLSLAWSAPVTGSAPTNYRVEVGLSPGTADYRVIDTNSTATTYSVLGPWPATFYVRLRAANAAGTSPASNEVRVTALSPPRGLTATAVGSTITLTWLPPATGATPTSYIIEAGSASGLADLASVTTGTTATSFSTTGVGDDIYYLRVRAATSAGNVLPRVVRAAWVGVDLLSAKVRAPFKPGYGVDV